MLARRADRLAAAAQRLGSSAIAIPCDVTDENAVARALARARESLGDAPDVLVNNAGIFDPTPLAAMAVASFREALAANLLAPFYLVHGVLPRMLERKAGHIVTIGSAVDRHTYAGNGAYGASKTGARALHEVLRAETRGSGVRATLVSPSSTATEIWDGVDQEVVRTPAAAAMLVPEDVAQAVLYAVTQPARVNVDELRVSRA